MFAIHKSKSFYFRSSRCFLTALGLAFLGTTASPLSASPCLSPVVLDAGESWRDSGRPAGKDACFSLSLDAGGILMIDVSAPALGTQARLTWLGAHEESIAPNPVLLRQSATSLIVRAGAGSYALRVEPEDAGRALPAFVLHTRAFTAGSKRETDKEIEVVPTGLSINPEINRETDKEIEVVPTGKVAPVLYDLSVLPEPLRKNRSKVCRTEVGDDHGDTLPCATGFALGRVMTSELSNDWGDDADVFRFRVDGLERIAIDAVGDAELVVSLYDRHGVRLGTAIDRGHGLRLARTLVPGNYFVKLEGRGAYALTVGSASR